MDGRAFTSAANGRQGGRPKLEATKLREALIKEAEARAEPLAKVLMDKAMTGDVPAIKEMMDRAIGKALQQMDHTTNGESLNEKISTLDDEQLEKLITGVQGTVGRTLAGKAEEDSAEPS
jgi:hypothetical protein